MRMLNWPLRSPFRGSNLFPGKLANVRRSGAASSISQFPERLTFDGFESPYTFPTEETLRFVATEGPDHVVSLYCSSVNLKQ